MTDTAWLVVAIIAGLVFAAAWVAREVWIHGRRRRRRQGGVDRTP